MPADLATGSEEEIEEELRLTYVATTRARDYLYVLWPLRYYSKSGGLSDNHSYAQCCRFFTGDVTQTMECISPAQKVNEMDTPAAGGVNANIHNQINKMWD
jgi:DNA helicase II / ATP-dependent DNA helicase PcrA